MDKSKLMYKSQHPRLRPLILTPILTDRRLCRGGTGLMLLHLSFVKLGLPSWPCPFLHSLSIPCPGCGLSRAILHLLQGNWHQSLRVHAFAPLAVIFLGLIAAIALLPVHFHRFLIPKLEKWEKRTGIGFFCLFSLIIYWIIRVLFFREFLYNVVNLQ
jgi:Protein of unknown function (DUF2752)